MKTFAEIHEAQMEAIKESRNPESRIVRTGFESVDKIIGGFYPGELIMLGARPSMGKTAFALSLAMDLSHRQTDVLYYSLDLSESQLYYRILCLLNPERLPPFPEIAFDDAFLKSYYEKHKEEIKHNRIKIEFDHSGSPEHFIEVTNTFASGNSAGKFIIVDSIQNFRTRARNRDQEVALALGAIKQQARVLGIPVMCLSQLSRSVEARGGDKRPNLSDLRDSGTLESDSDKVMMLYRAEYYGMTQDHEGRSTTGVAELIIASNNIGAIGTAQLFFNHKNADISDAGFLDNINFSQQNEEDPF